MLCCLCCFMLTIYAQKRDLLQVNGLSGNVAIRNTKQWQQKRMQILDSMQAVMGKLPSEKLPAPQALFIDTLKMPEYCRYTIHIASYKNEVVPALLYIPHIKQQKLPAMLALHGTGKEGKHLVDSFTASPNRATATELVRRGYIVLAPDYPSFGELANHDFDADRFESGSMQAVFNHMRCIDYLQSRPDVSEDRIGVIGHSLGGHNAIFLGAFDQRVKVVVASCGWTLFGYYDAGEQVTKMHGGKLGPWAQERYMPLVRTKYALSSVSIPFDFDEAIAAIAPRYFITSSPLYDSNFSLEGVKQGIASVQPVYELLKAPDHLKTYYPQAGHDFPATSRFKVYEDIDRVLK